MNDFQKISKLGSFALMCFPSLLLGGYGFYEMWFRLDKYERRMRAFYGESSIFYRWFVSPYAVWLGRIITILLVTWPLLIIIIVFLFWA